MGVDGDDIVDLVGDIIELFGSTEQQEHRPLKSNPKGEGEGKSESAADAKRRRGAPAPASPPARPGSGRLNARE